MDEVSIELVNRWRAGDQRAADELFERYAGRLLALARTRLAGKVARRLDAEDVLQSAYRSFFSGVRGGRYVLEQSGDLWRLLAAITLHKVHNQVRHHTTDRRSVEREQTFATEDSLLGLQIEALAREPSPEDAAAVIDEIEYIMSRLQPSHRRMVELRLQGCDVAEIAAEIKRSGRLVRRVLEQVRTELHRRCLE